MRKSAILLSLIAFLFVSQSSFANHFADFYVIPVAIDAPGVNNTNWMSDVAIYNFSSLPLTVSLTFIRSGENMPDNFETLDPDEVGMSIGPGDSVLIKDVLDQVGGRPNNLGAILVGGSQPFAITSRTYSMNPTGDTVGQTVLPARDFLENAVGDVTIPGATAYIPGLIQNARFRTNLGFVAATTRGNGMTVSVTLRDADGASAGSRSFFIGGEQFLHVQFSARSISSPSTRNFDIGAADFIITQGDGAVVPYASVIDNVTADAVYVTGQFPPTTPFAKTGVKSAFQTLMERRLEQK